MDVGLAIYRGVTAAIGAIGPPLVRALKPRGEWSAVWSGHDEESVKAAGSIWVHAASLGEVGVARSWIETLLQAGSRPPILLTVRTRAGLERARRELGDRVVARPAPIDLPTVIRERLDGACPSRLDIIETELWPNLIYEARRCRVPVALVGATVSERTARRLRILGIAGEDLFGAGVFAMAQSEAHAARFRGLGIPADRVRVVGDLKAEPPPANATVPFSARPALVFGSLRAGEEPVALRAARLLERFRAEQGWQGAVEPRSIPPAGWEGRSRALLVVAPRHASSEGRVRAVLEGGGFEVVTRSEPGTGDRGVASWIDDVSRRGGPRVALLATRGELPDAYGSAWGAVVGGTFVPVGGHSAWEPASRGTPVIVGPYHHEVLAAVDAVVRAGGGTVSADATRHFDTIVLGWLRDEDLASRGTSASRAAAAAAGAAGRALTAIEEWGLLP